MATKDYPALSREPLRVHHRAVVGLSDKNLRGQEMMDEFLIGSFWRRIFDGVKEPLFECYDEYMTLDLVVLTPQEVGLHTDNRISLSSFFSHVVRTFPELELVKPEVAFRVQRDYDLEIGEAHYFAIPQPGVIMRDYDLGTREIGFGLSHGGLRLMGVPHLQKENAVYRILQPVPRYDIHWTRHDVRWVFALKAQVDMGATPTDENIRESSHQSSGNTGVSYDARSHYQTAQNGDGLIFDDKSTEEQMDRDLDDALSFLKRVHR